MEHVAPKLGDFGVGAATGTATAAMIKATNGLPPAQRATAIAGTALITAAATKIGLGIGGKVVKNTSETIIENIKNSKHGDPNINRIPSPGPDNTFIHSPLEEQSPLEGLIIHQFELNILILLLIIILLILIFNRFILSSNLDFITSLVEKYIPNTFIAKYIKKFNITSRDYNNKFMFIMFIIISIVLIMMLLLNIFVSTEFILKLDQYVTVYNRIHNK
jgi:hypothetical protein